MKKLLLYISYKFDIFQQYLLDKFLNQHRKIEYKGVSLYFFTPNALNKYRIKTFSTKEPETLDWIDTFESDTVFWDIGANIGLYSIYAAKSVNVQVFAFEPSVFNLELLAKNIHRNALSEKIQICPLALSSHSGFNLFRMNNPVWGGALSTFGEKYDQNGENFNATLEYSIPGLPADKLQDLLLVPGPDYIKIDVDGIEHLILKGCRNVLENAKSVLVEINDDFWTQSNTSKKYLSRAGLTLKGKFYLGSGNHYNQLWVREE